VQIRPVTDADRDTVIALWQRVFPEYADPDRPQRDPAANFARKLAMRDGLFWLAERDGDVIGTAMAGYDGHRGWLYSVGVLPSQRGRGVGRALVLCAEAVLAQLGCPKLNLQVLERNDIAREFWKALGYQLDPVESFGKQLIGPLARYSHLAELRIPSGAQRLPENLT
jgi:ribosomal protein S18 acetylase RimI-like enzyme